MKRTNLIILGLIATVFLFSGCGYNSMVKLDEKVSAQWAQVENVYQRRADLIPNLVNTVKGYANFEKDVLTAVTEARAKATSVNVDASKLSPESIQQFQQAQGQTCRYGVAQSKFTIYRRIVVGTFALWYAWYQYDRILSSIFEAKQLDFKKSSACGQFQPN